MQSMMWYLNGVVIQSLKSPPPFEERSFGLYQGIARYQSWPVVGETIGSEQGASKLYEEANERWFYCSDETGEYSLWAVPEDEYVRRYLEACKKFGIQFRLLFVSSTHKLPSYIGSKYSPTSGGAKFLGYDYSSASGDYSAVLDDFAGIVPRALAELVSDLNEMGLFASEESFARYLRVREELIEADEPLESGVSLRPIKLWQLLQC
jgi:hypothetical protein